MGSLRGFVLTGMALLTTVAAEAEEATELQGVTLSLAIRQAALVEGEPAVTVLTLTNVSDGPAQSAWASEYRFAREAQLRFTVEMTSAEREWKIPPTSSFSSELPWHGRIGNGPTMPPGASFTCERMFVPSGIPLDSGGRPMATTELIPPGEYQVQARLFCRVKDGVRWVNSSKVDLTIRPAQGKDREALKLLASSDMRALLGADMMADPAAGEAFLAEHPDTTYAKYVRAETIRTVLERLANKGPAEVDAKQADDLLSRAKAFVKLNPDFPRSDNILVSVGRALRQLDRDLEARDAFLRVREIYPDSDAASLVQGQIERLPEWARQGVESPPPE